MACIITYGGDILGRVSSIKSRVVIIFHVVL